jgi:hypothetical protein
MSQLATYISSEVIVVITQLATGVSERLVGFIDGSFIDVNREVPTWTKSTGADGHTTRSHSANEGGDITVRLQQGSPSNDFLDAIWTRDNATKNGLISIIVKDGSGRSFDQCDQAYIASRANKTYSGTDEGREWVIECPKFTTTVNGGNSLVDAALVENLSKLDRPVADEWKL